MPCLHSPVVSTSVPSASMRAWSKNVVRLPGPGLDADVVEDVQERVHILGLEAPAEIAGGGRIGDAAGAQGIEEDLVVAAQFDVLQAGAVAQGVVGEVEDVIRLVVRQMDLEQVQPVVDGLGEPELAHQEVHGADAAVSRCRGRAR